MDEVKDVIMKDLEIFLTESILPEIEKKINPPAEESTAQVEESLEAEESA